ncbi:MAG: alpha/beta hydrolase [Planctomycetes bacterium]|nr:alpha/beta hydrolase [Planctomycetota bacterium]
MRLVLIPGLGLDRRFFEPQRTLPFDLDVPDWPDPRAGETLEAYADRMADHVGAADALGGVSFGGMLAQAMARRLRPRVVIGIGSARTGRDIPGVLHLAESVLRQLPALKATPGRWAVNLGFLGPLKESHKRFLMPIIADSSMELVRAASRMILEWRGSDVPCPAYFIHGDRDVIIRARTVRPDRLIRGGGHLISLTHPKAVNAFIEECVRKAGTG